MKIEVKVLNEAGYEQAMLGISFNKDQNPENMPKVAAKLAPLDGGHNKFLEQMYIWLDVTAPRYWWQEADTYRLSSKSSQSTMHTILKNELKQHNFEEPIPELYLATLNSILETNDLPLLKSYLPEGFLQRRMWCMSYKTFKSIVQQRKNHRLPHWHKFIREIYSTIQHKEFLPELKEGY